MTIESAQRFGFGLYSARFGNIYYVRQLLQLAREAIMGQKPEHIIWEKEGRFYDALRPSIEPVGFDAPEKVELHRAQHVRRVRNMFAEADVFVYTFGLTEGWVHRASGTVYPTAPGTIAGEFDANEYVFKNFTFNEVYNDFLEFRELLRTISPDVRFLITVSPVALAATASGDHILKSTIYSKSVLRAVAGELYDKYDDIDYFPSYDLITGNPTKGRFFDESLRDVTPAGVECVMRYFFSQHSGRANDQYGSSEKFSSEENVLCEDALLEAFGE